MEYTISNLSHEEVQTLGKVLASEKERLVRRFEMAEENVEYTKNNVRMYGAKAWQKSHDKNIEALAKIREKMNTVSALLDSMIVV